MYKKNYLIGIYGPIREGEPLLGLCDNIKEFSQLLGINKNTAGVILHKLWNKQTRFIRFNGRLCTVEFILDVESNEQ